MPILVQPTEIDIPADDPFANDLLGRRESIEALTALLGNIEGPCVMAVDASWGMGKTTFLRMWAGHLKEQGHHVIEFNAWETDFTWDPFFALWSEVSAQLAEQPSVGPSGRLASLARKLMPFLRGGASGASLAFAVGGESDAAVTAAGISTTLKNVEEAADASDQEHGAAGRTPFPESTYTEAKSLLNEFRVTLQEEASALAGASGGLPLVVLIDELDRCRPTYAIELIETAKHLFSVDHIIFVLCLDRTQLAHSVKAVYGSEFAADGYLRRFFDVDYRLPEPSRTDFLAALGEELLVAEQIEVMASDGRLYSRIGEPASLRFIITILDASPLSLRDLQQALSRLNLLLASVRKHDFLHLETLIVLLILRMLEPGLYRRVLAGDATDEEAIAVFRLRKSDRRDIRMTVRIVIEAVLSASVCLASSDASGQPDEDMVPALLRYRRASESPRGEATRRRGEQTVAEWVVQYVSAFCGRDELDGEWDFARVSDGLSFSSTVSCLELLPEQ